MRKLRGNNEADTSFITMGIALFVTIFISLIIVYNIAGSMDTADIDEQLQDNMGASIGYTPAGNATVEALDQSETFYTIAPLAAVIMVAVAILGYVMMIGRR